MDCQLKKDFSAASLSFSNFYNGHCPLTPSWRKNTGLAVLYDSCVPGGYVVAGGRDEDLETALPGLTRVH